MHSRLYNQRKKQCSAFVESSGQRQRSVFAAEGRRSFVTADYGDKYGSAAVVLVRRAFVWKSAIILYCA